MPRVADRNKGYFSNPIKNLEDLFFYIQKTLKCEHSKRKGGYKLSVNSLSVDFRRKAKDANIREELLIKKKWADSSEEKISYTSRYIEQQFYEQRERELMRSEPEADSEYRATFEWPGYSRKLSKEIYIDSLILLQVPLCTLEYQTNNLGRGLRTLASLKIYPEKRGRHDEKERPLVTLYLEMVRAAGWLLTKQLGNDRKEWKKGLQIGKASVEIPFKKKFEEVYAPWIVGYSLVDLCRYYHEKRSGRIKYLRNSLKKHRNLNSRRISF